MKKKEFIKTVCDLLRSNNIKKPISIPKHVFHISDDEGNTRDFTVKKRDKTAIYTIDDITNIVDACINVVYDCVKRGEPVSFFGFGTIKVLYRKPRKTKQVGTNEDIVIEGRYVPKFDFGNNLRMCARVYGMSLNDKAPDTVEVPIDSADKEGGG